MHAPTDDRVEQLTCNKSVALHCHLDVLQALPRLLVGCTHEHVDYAVWGGGDVLHRGRSRHQLSLHTTLHPCACRLANFPVHPALPPNTHFIGVLLHKDGRQGPPAPVRLHQHHLIPPRQRSPLCSLQGHTTGAVEADAGQTGVAHEILLAGARASHIPQQWQAAG